METHQLKKLIEFFSLLVLTIIPMAFLSISLMGIPPLGNLLFPGNGIWKVPGELPDTVRYNIPDLKGEVTVIRDEWGVPHIYADYEKDLFFVQGYCHAQDRLFEMDLIRRQVRGQLYEILGSEDALVNDKFMLAMGMEDWAIESDKIAREMQNNGTIDFFPNFERYVDGINYYIDTHKNQKPIEYYLLDFEPEQWTTVDTFCLIQEMARQLSWNYNDLYRYINLVTLNETFYEELFGLPLPYQIPIVPDYGGYGEIPMKSGANYEKVQPVQNEILNFLNNIEQIKTEKELIETQKNQISGSNNWVANGIKTSTGYPILCNDMHLGWILPGVWYEQHLKAEDTGLNVYGFAIPGMPLCAVGHNEKVGWGYTNTGYDVIDWYYYDAVDDNNYVYNNSITPFTYKTYDIKVKNGDPIQFTVRHTKQGPVLSDLRDFGLPSSLGDVIIAPRWIANGVFFNLLAGNGFCHANNRAEFDEASKYWTILAQNIVYADVDGNIAIRPTGKVPIRDDSRIPVGHLGNGTIPYNGSNGEGEWIGYIPFEALPSSLNPAQNYLASANQLVAGPGYTEYFLQNEYADG
jgi:penicillin amidase